jgi:hypothetical protein
VIAGAITLAGGRQLVLRRDEGRDLLTLREASTGRALTITVTEGAVEVALHCAALALTTDGDLTIEAGRIALHGRRGLALATEGSAIVEVGESLVARASAHEITAVRGDVRVVANDDIQLEGERIRLNG